MNTLVYNINIIKYQVITADKEWWLSVLQT